MKPLYVKPGMEKEVGEIELIHKRDCLMELFEDELGKEKD